MGAIAPFVVAKLEMALKDSAEDAWLLGAILLMVWGGLRWSDVQRLQFSSLVIDDKSIRGWCWRTKSSKHGMPNLRGDTRHVGAALWSDVGRVHESDA